MGTVFSLPWARLTDWHAAPALLREAGFLTVALTLADSAVDLDEVARRLDDRPQPVAVLLGTEGAGLSGRWSAAADVRATIAMQAGVDSLNVAAASAIACYVLAESSSSSTSSGSSGSTLRGVTGQSSG